MGLNLVAVCYNARQDNTIQYNAITHVTQNNIEHSRQPSIRKITTTKNLERIAYTIEAQKGVEPKLDEQVLKTTMHTKQWANHTIQDSITHISPRPTPHSTSPPLYTRTLHILLRLILTHKFCINFSFTMLSHPLLISIYSYLLNGKNHHVPDNVIFSVLLYVPSSFVCPKTPFSIFISVHSLTFPCGSEQYDVN